MSEVMSVLLMVAAAQERTTRVTGHPSTCICPKCRKVYLAAMGTLRRRKLRK